MRAVLLAALLVLACCASEASLGAPARHPCGVEALFFAGLSYPPLPYSSCSRPQRLVAAPAALLLRELLLRELLSDSQEHVRLRLA
jgi:hypothetical protein